MERRLAAILAADVVGYSRLMGTDEVGTLTALNAHRSEFIDPKFAEHKGRIVKLMGDGALSTASPQLCTPATVCPRIETKTETGVRNRWHRARDLNLPRAISQLVAESILGGFVPTQPLNRGSERKPKPEYEIVEIGPPI